MPDLFNVSLSKGWEITEPRFAGGFIYRAFARLIENQGGKLLTRLFRRIARYNNQMESCAHLEDAPKPTNRNAVFPA